MSPDLISFSTIALAIFVICAGFVLLRGIMRIFLGCVVLGGSAWVGLRLWQLGPDLVRACFGNYVPWLAGVIPIVGFIITFLLGRMLVKFLYSPFQNTADEYPKPPLTLTRLLGAAFFTLIPTCLVATIVAILIYHAGAVTEIRDSAGKAPHSRMADTALALKASVLKSIPQAWLQLFDPTTDPSRLELAKAITRESKTPSKPVIDPKTGEAIPRAIIVDDPELQGLAREGKFGTLLRHPLLTKTLEDPKIKALLKDLNL
jgi:hypothetical protein